MKVTQNIIWICASSRCCRSTILGSAVALGGVSFYDAYAATHSVSSAYNSGTGSLRELLSMPTLAAGDMISLDASPQLSSYLTISKPKLTLQGSDTLGMGASISALNWKSLDLTNDIGAILEGAASGGLATIQQTVPGASGQLFRSAGGIGNGAVFDGIYFRGKDNSQYSTANHTIGTLAFYNVNTASSSVIGAVENSIFSDMKVTTTGEIASVGISAFSSDNLSGGPAEKARIDLIKSTIFSNLGGTVSNNWLSGVAVGVHATMTSAAAQGANYVARLQTLDNTVFNSIFASLSSTNANHYLLGGTVSVNSDYGTAEIDTVSSSLFNNINAIGGTTGAIARNVFGGGIYAGVWQGNSADSIVKLGTIVNTVFNNFTISGLNVHGGAVAAHMNQVKVAGDHRIGIDLLSKDVFNAFNVSSATGGDIIGGVVSASITPTAASTSLASRTEITSVEDSTFSNITLTSGRDVIGGAVASRTDNADARIGTIKDSSFEEMHVSANATVFGGAVGVSNASATQSAVLDSISGSHFEELEVSGATVLGGAVGVRNLTTASSARISSVANSDFSNITVTGTTVNGGVIYSSGDILDLSNTSFERIYVAGTTVNGSLVYAGGKIDNASNLSIDIGSLPENVAAIYANGDIKLAGTLRISGLPWHNSAVWPPAAIQKASTLSSATWAVPLYTVAQTNGGTISGGFTLPSGPEAATTTPYDFIAEQTNLSGDLSTDSKRYSISGSANLALAWTGGGTQAGTGTFTINAGTLVDGFNVDVSLTDQASLAYTSGWDGKSLTKMGDGTLLVSAPSSYTGQTTIESGTLRAGAANVLSSFSAHAVASKGSIDLNGHGQVAASLNNAGVVQFGQSASPGTRLTVAGPYTSSGGLMEMNVSLGNDSASSDRLIAGSVLLGGGATRVQINNAAGLGALTTGNGITVVEVTGGSSQSAPGAFVLDERIAAGAYEYQLYQGAVNTNDGNWYLRSFLDCTLDSSVAECQVKSYRPEIFVDSTIPVLANRLGRESIGSYRNRVSGAVAEYGHSSAVWMRAFGRAGKTRAKDSDLISRTESFEKNGPLYDDTYEGLQIGMDVVSRLGENGSRWFAGAYMGKGNARANVFGQSAPLAGKVTMDSYSLGAYQTFLTTDGAYIDAVVQATRYLDVVGTALVTQGQTLKAKGAGLLASLEGASPYALGSGWYLEPRVQVIYQYLGIDSSADNFGLVDFKRASIAHGKAELRLARDWFTDGLGAKMTAWALASAGSSFGAAATTTFSNLDGANPLAIDADLDNHWAQIEAGVAGKMTKSVSTYLVGDYLQSLGDVRRSSVAVRGGLRFEF